MVLKTQSTTVLNITKWRSFEASKFGTECCQVVFKFELDKSRKGQQQQQKGSKEKETRFTNRQLCWTNAESEKEGHL